MAISAPVAGAVRAAPPERPTVLAVIVNYRTPQLVIDCLRSLETEVAANPGLRVVVVDNASGDDSCQRIAAAIEACGWSAWARLRASPLNGGFAYGNNLAMRETLGRRGAPDVYWLLNPDTQVRPGAVRAMAEFFGQHPRAGIVGSLLELDDGTAWPFAFRFPSALGELATGLGVWKLAKLLSNRSVLRPMGDQPAVVDWLPGASMMIRRDVVESVGLMDEAYFLYFEETDYCLQARRKGWECWYVPQARVMHIAGQSTGVTSRNAAPKRLPQYWFDSRRRYFVKNHGRAYAAAVDLAWLVSYALRRLRQRLRRKADEDPPRLLADFVRNSALLNTGIPCHKPTAGR